MLAPIITLTPLPGLVPSDEPPDPIVSASSFFSKPDAYASPEPLPNVLYLDDYIGRIHLAMAQPWPSLRQLEHKYPGETLIIAGGGPSIKDPETLSLIRKLHKKRGVKIIAPNRSHDFLISKGIIPDFGVVIDWGSHVAGYIKKWQRDTKYIIGHQVAPETYKVWSDAPIKPHIVFVEANCGEYDVLRNQYPERRDWICIGGKNTIGMRCLEIGGILGFRNFELVGFDSCYRDGKLYGYHKGYIEEESAADFTLAYPNGSGARTFRANASMAKQLNGFCLEMQEMDARIAAKKMPRMKVRVWGDGALPYAAKIMSEGGFKVVTQMEIPR